MTRDTGPAELVRATLESVCYQTSDLLNAMNGDGQAPLSIRIDGGMVQNNWLCDFLADVLDVDVERPQETETTALGAAYLAGLQVGIFDSINTIAKNWQSESKFKADMDESKRSLLLANWHKAVRKVTSHD
jgi:glycerol kinase